MFVDLGDLLPWHVANLGANLGALSILLIAVLWRRYTTKRDGFVAQDKRDDAKGPPWTFPYVFPLLGSLPIAYLWDPRAFVLDRK